MLGPLLYNIKYYKTRKSLEFCTNTQDVIVNEDFDIFGSNLDPAWDEKRYIHISRHKTTTHISGFTRKFGVAY